MSRQMPPVYAKPAEPTRMISATRRICTNSATSTQGELNSLESDHLTDSLHNEGASPIFTQHKLFESADTTVRNLRSQSVQRENAIDLRCNAAWVGHGVASDRLQR